MIKKTRGASSKERKLTFILPADEPEGPVSVVGDFNQWTPGKHELRKRSNGTRSVAVAVPAGSTVRFRYLGQDGHWFDDPQAQDSGGGSVVQV